MTELPVKLRWLAEDSLVTASNLGSDLQGEQPLQWEECMYETRQIRAVILGQ